MGNDELGAGPGEQAAVPARLAASCRSVRPGRQGDEVGGVLPRYVAAPASTGEAGALLAAADELNLTVVPRGSGSRLGWGTPPRSADLVVDTSAMDQVVEHAAGDLTATVQAGVSLEKLAEVLGAAGQRLALDPPPGLLSSGTGAGQATRGTIGGVLATGAAGPLRLRYGSGRDLMIGVTFVRADGQVAKAGGKVVKNVAGYDLGKLLAGSLGTLGLVTEATFRLHPLPAATAFVTLRYADAASACQAVTAAGAAALSPVAVELDWPSPDAPVDVAVALEGEPGPVATRAQAALAVLSGLAGAQVVPETEQAPPWWGRWPGDGAALAPAGPGPDGAGTLVKVAFWPGQLAARLAALRAAAGAAGVDAAVRGSAAAGVLHAALPAGTDPDRVARFVTGLRADLGHQGVLPDDGEAGPPGATAVVLCAPPAVRDLVDLWGPVQSLPLMQPVKDQFDPGHRMSPGRFAGGI